MEKVRKHIPLGILLVPHLVLSLTGCTQDLGETRPTGTMAATTDPPPAISDTAQMTPSPTPSRVIPSTTPTHPLPSATSPPNLPTATPSGLPTAVVEPTMPPTDTPAEPKPSTTPTLAPTATLLPTTPPTPTAPPQQIAPDPRGIRIELQPIVGGLDIPVGLAQAADGSNRLFVLEKPGRIRIVENRRLLERPFLDITDRVGSSASEQGLLGLAFHPRFMENGLFFLNYTDLQGATVITRFSVSDDPNLALPDSEDMLLVLDQPAANHNGGHLAFGPDGYLYIGMGDGGGAGDRFANGQNGQTLLGAMLRLDIDRDQPYAVPADNPFLDVPTVRDEIWAIGLRNPWRFSFDRSTGDLHIADVGQNRFEEVNVQPAGSPGGQNYGWPIMEGRHCFPESASCDDAGLTLPVAEYDHSLGCSVTGGYVYRGNVFPEMVGLYLFGDYCSGRIWGLVSGQTGDGQVAELAQVGQLRISSFGEDEAGELYLLDMAGGGLYWITAQTR